MLPNYYKFHIINDTGATIEFSTDGANNSFVITAVPWKFDTDGALEYGSEITLFADPTSDLTDTSSLEAAAEVNNTVNKYLGLLCHAILTTDAATAGTLNIYWEWSTDGATGTYPSDATDYQADEDLIFIRPVITASTNEDRAINFAL